MNDHEMLRIVESLVAHLESVNYAFYVVGKPSAVRAAMAPQKELLQRARHAIAGFKAAVEEPSA